MGEAPNGPSTTEDAAAAPGWVESSLDEIMAALPKEPALSTLRGGYLDCLAGARGDDLDTSHDRCRRTFLQGLEERLRLDDNTLRALEKKLEALEAEITERI